MIICIFRTDTRIWFGWQQHTEAQRQCQGPGFSYGEPEKDRPRFKAKSESEHTS